ncbi:hypothetical protein, partial [Sphingopyxis sp. KK2]|uniref:hypothetical protein n=1 Tax=Sphingopyxis sp. KK2 TaxID=1855727 RepID=UPI001C4E03CA
MRRFDIDPVENRKFPVHRLHESGAGNDQPRLEMAALAIAFRWCRSLCAAWLTVPLIRLRKPSRGCSGGDLERGGGGATAAARLFSPPAA